MSNFKTVDLKGKKYVMVNDRVKFFREQYPGWSLESEVIKMSEGVCAMKATVKDETGRVIATGHAYEKEGSSFINKTSALENCETSAWGRALGNLGIGIDESMASAQEVANAMIQQKAMKSVGQTPEAFQKIVNGEVR